MSPAADALVARLAKLEAGQVSDVLDEAGQPHHALSSALRPLAPGYRFAGPAVCLRGALVVPGRNPVPALPGDALEQALTPGCILLAETGGFTGGATLGGLFAFSLQRGGCAAVISDGAVRDAEEIRGLGLPVLSAAVTPVNGARRMRWVAAQVPIALPCQSGGTVTVAPGDLVLGDDDGVVVVPAAVAGQIVEDSERLAEIEAKIAEEMRAGAARAEAFKRNPRFDHVRPALKPGSEEPAAG